MTMDSLNWTNFYIHTHTHTIRQLILNNCLIGTYGKIKLKRRPKGIWWLAEGLFQQDIMTKTVLSPL